MVRLTEELVPIDNPRKP